MKAHFLTGTGWPHPAARSCFLRHQFSASFDVSYILRNAQYALDVRKMNTIRREVKIREGLLAESGFGLGGCLLVLDKEHMSLLEG